MATLINGVVIKRFNTLLELYNYNSDRLGEEVYVLDTAGDNNSPGGYSIYKKNVGDNNWDRIFDSISISTKLKELILDIDTFGNAVSLEEDIIEFSNATVLSIINENGNDVLIEDVIFSAGASNYPVKSSPNNIVVGQQYAGKKFRAICTVSNAVDKNTSFEDNPNLQLTKVNLELENVDNTSDINKPISTLTQTALDTKVDKVANKVLSDNNLTNDLKNTIESSTQHKIIFDSSDANLNFGFGDGLPAGEQINVNYSTNTKYLIVVFHSIFAGASNDDMTYMIHKISSGYAGATGWSQGISAVLDSDFSSQHYQNEKTYSRSVAKWSQNKFLHSNSGYIFIDTMQIQERQQNTGYVVKKIIEVS